MTLALGYAPGSRQLLRAQFQDLCRNTCSIQEASKADESAIWVGVSQNAEGHMSTRMLLSQSMAKDILPFIQTFAETGALTPAVAKDTKLSKLEVPPMKFGPAVEQEEEKSSLASPKPKRVAKPIKIKEAPIATKAATKTSPTRKKLKTKTGGKLKSKTVGKKRK